MGGPLIPIVGILYVAFTIVVLVGNGVYQYYNHGSQNPPDTQVSPIIQVPNHGIQNPPDTQVSPIIQVPRVLDYYNADRDLEIIREWKEMVRTPIDLATQMEQLENEARDVTGKPGTRMLEYLQRALRANRLVAGLTPAECWVVTMYSYDNDSTAFFIEYNRATASRNWQPYRVYTTLLVSALRNLATTYPIPRDAILYRGINFRPEPPTATRIIWNRITSTSQNPRVAEGFTGGPDGSVLVFELTASCQAARIRDLANFQGEEEIILLPFVVFDFLSVNATGFYFRGSQDSPDCSAGG